MSYLILGVTTWKEAFKKLYHQDKKKYKIRLKELTTWDDRGPQEERGVKIIALKLLIEEGK